MCSELKLLESPNRIACVHRKILNTLRSQTSGAYPIVLKPAKYNIVPALVYL